MLTRSAFGPFAGFPVWRDHYYRVCADSSQIVFFIGSYLNTLFPMCLSPLWILFYGVFVAINIHSTRLTLKVGLFITLLAVLFISITMFHVCIQTRTDS